MRRRRRTRYTFSAVSPRGVREDIDVLAYSAENAEATLRRHGYTEARKHATPAPPPRQAPQWRKNAANIAEAIEFLGLTLPVSIKQTGRRGGRQGAHQLRGVDGRDRFYSRGRLSDFDVAADVGHYITVKDWLDPFRAGEVIWHELCHAKQAEDVIAALPAPVSPREKYDAWVTCEARGKGVTYMRKPIEVEAREYEAFNREVPLAV